MDYETKSLLGQLKTEWEQFKDLHASHRAETAETKQALERCNSAIQEIEEKIERSSLNTHRRHGPSAVKREFVDWCRGAVMLRKMGNDPHEYKLLDFSQEDAAAVLAGPELITEMLEIAYAREPLLGLVRTRRISRGSMSYPTKDSRAGAVWDADVADYTTETGTASYGKGDIEVFGAHAIASIKAESLEDPEFDLAADLLGDWAYAFGEKDGLAVHSGSGTGRPTGILTNADVELVPTGDADALTYGGIVDLVASLKDAYEARARFVLNKKTLFNVRKIEDTEGHLIWQPEMAQGNPGTILGYPYAKSENMADVAAEAVPILFGDFFAGYWLVQRVDVQVQRDPYTAWPHVVFKARKRVGGDVVMPEAIKALIVSVDAT